MSCSHDDHMFFFLLFVLHTLKHNCYAVCRFIELDEGETVESVTQHDIVQAVDITSAQKVLASYFFQFLARDVIYTSCAYATMSVSVCLSICL